VREEYDCEGLREFAEAFGDDVANNMVQEVCEAFYGASRDTRRVGRVRDMHKETLDREGGNHTFTGYIDHGARCWEFEIQDGNWDGTVVRTWDRAWKHPAKPAREEYDCEGLRNPSGCWRPFLRSLFDILSTASEISSQAHTAPSWRPVPFNYPDGIFILDR
jgi:hypothetical protein